ncbi:3-oxoacyl-[acyl-carrier protein] reductase [Paenibacillus sophorae]|uniref:3-oxoacyl-[acyl-carrier protein] reductase n=1 Tax=Paenibacillus sophorae TaxID=1333845 RepID=A0A1H8J182_9BACL|nr:SDR family oxidoreductase [Paenibacillus sophorae]QWU16157.1 SDR family oxidoreductase [Paenibacillus sophorae]SEN74145.1 3-oxoacyl-[acyl-carrier protein] reductase [Paenibacillus sophorae]
MENNLVGKVALVTGASRGMGREIAENLARHGAKVVVNYASSPGKAEEVVAGIKQQGGEAIAIQADISKVAEVESLFKKTLEAYGQVDILVNNAGIMITKPIANITEEDFDKQFAINVKGTFFACQQAALHMNENGRIINFSTSVTGQMFPTYSSYAGTKGAVEQITRQLAKELGPKGITINAVAPGPVNTELFTVGKSEEQIKAVGNMNSFGRLGEPEDISNVVLSLASQESQWVTGQTLRVNGGFI